ncbi:MAG: hypothetical protein QOG80_59 [Pseudonocardiales bacterium]|jgi:uncharacterized membrane protein YccC|nr:hypothetical protein [Pseudonocardiales bacterium]
MIAVTHFASSAPDFTDRATAALSVLAARPGYVRGSLGRSVDADDRWVLVTEWHNVGSYRRALGNYDVRLHATPLLAEALDLPGAFEALVEVAPGGAAVFGGSDRA